jgi:hypothetical protein
LIVRQAGYLPVKYGSGLVFKHYLKSVTVNGMLKYKTPKPLRGRFGKGRGRVPVSPPGASFETPEGKDERERWSWGNRYGGKGFFTLTLALSRQGRGFISL